MAVKEIRIEKSKKKFFNKENIILLIILGVVVIYGIITLISQQISISQKTQELSQINDKIVIQDVKNQDLSQINDEIVIQEVKNEDLNDDLNDDKYKEYIESLARENLGYAYNGERIFINIAGE